MLDTAVIYSIIHKPSGRVYVGQTREKYPMIRYRRHIYSSSKGSKTHFHCALRLYGEAAFDFVILEKCSRLVANDRERFYIAKLRSNIKAYGFNMSEGGDGGQNSMSAEVRLKISNTKKGVLSGPCSAEKAKTIREAKLLSGYTHSKETREKIKSNRAKLACLTPEWKKAISLGLRKSTVYKLSSESLEEIKSKLDQSDATLSKIYEVSRKTIWRIRKGLYGSERFGDSV